MYLPVNVQEIGKIDVNSFKEPLLEISEEQWLEDRRRQWNPHFKESVSLWPRVIPFSDDEFFHTFDKLMFFKNTKFIEECNKIHQKIESLLNGYVIKSNIIRLDPGKETKTHVDGLDKIFRQSHRIILPIITNEKSFIQYEQESYHLKEGVMYDTCTYMPHNTINLGDTSRYHMVLDIIFKTNIEHFEKIKIYGPDQWKEFNEVSSKFKKLIGHTFIDFIDGGFNNWEEVLDLERKLYEERVKTGRL